MKVVARVASAVAIFVALAGPSSFASAAPSAVYVPVGGASCVSGSVPAASQGVTLDGQALSELMAVIRNPGRSSGTSRVAELMARGSVPQVDGESGFCGLGEGRGCRVCQ